jgi:signal transduction histidine kinase
LNETLEQRVAERTAEVQSQAEQLRALANQLSRTEMRERKRLADVLHDNIQQLLGAACIQTQQMSHYEDPALVHGATKNVLDILREAIDACRSLAVNLSPPVLNEAGLKGGLNWLVPRMRERYRFTVRVRSEIEAEPATEEMRYVLFECVRELLFNVVKHAGVSEADVVLMRTRDDQIKIVVRDDGKGFDPDLLKKRRPEEATFGLFSIEQRLAHFGGCMEVRTTPGGGTQITLTAPAGQPAAKGSWGS